MIRGILVLIIRIDELHLKLGTPSITPSQKRSSIRWLLRPLARRTCRTSCARSCRQPCPRPASRNTFLANWCAAPSCPKVSGSMTPLHLKSLSTSTPSSGTASKTLPPMTCTSKTWSWCSAMWGLRNCSGMCPLPSTAT